MGLDVMYSKLESAPHASLTAVLSRLRRTTWRQLRSEDRSGQLVVPVPRPSRLLSLIA